MNRILRLFLFLLSLNTIGKASSPDFSPSLRPDFPVSDTTRPLIFCPGSQIINLAPMRCDTVVQYVVNAFDDQGQVILILLDGIASGGAFPSGATVNTWLATDLAGNTATCSFTVSTFEPLTQPVCKDPLNVYLDQNCAKNLKAFDILEGGPYGCPIHFTTEVDKTLPFGNGPWQNAIFNAADINMVYQVRVTSLLTGAKCWSTITVKDNMPPVILCQDINVPCAVPLEQLTPPFLRDSFGISIAVPVVNDACSGSTLSISFVDVLQNLPCDDTTTVSGIIRRIWSATDAYGNTGTCEQIIRRHRQLAAVQIPGNKTTTCANPDLSESTNGIPYIQFSSRKYELTPASYCEFDLSFFDTIQPGSCGGNYHVQRTWKIYDACLPLSATNPKTGIQDIEVKDLNGPVIHCPASLIVTTTDVNCRASVDLPDVFVSDACSALSSFQAFWTDSSISKTLTGTVEYDTDSTGVDTIGVLGVVASFPVGTTTLLYTAEDACGNSGDCSFNLTVANLIAPTAKCDSLLVVGLPTNGYLSIPAMVLDNGSADDCSPLVFKAKLSALNDCNTESLLSDTLHVCCHNSGDTLAGTLRVYDVAVPTGAVSNTYGMGHFTDCAFKIRVSGNNAPSCTAPANITVGCEAFDPTLESYGGLVAQSCSVDSVMLTVNTAGFDTLCSRGTITRLFKVFSETGQTGQCTQKIVVNYNQEYYIRFPDDVIVTACDTANMYGAPSYFGKDCELLNATFEDERFNVVPDACYKIERTWKIVNWCTFDPGGTFIEVPNPNPNPITNNPENLVGPIVSPIQAAGDPWKASLVKLYAGATSPTDFSIFYNANANGYTYKQIIKVIDTQKPVVENCPSDTIKVQDLTTNDPLLWNAQYWFDPVLVSSDMCESATDLSITTTDACSGSNVTIYFQLLLDLNGDNLRETVVSSTNLPPSNTVYFNNSSGPGEARQFDFRPVPANQKWRFAMQEVVVGNKKIASVRFNTTAAPDTYVLPQLAYGNHKIRWFVTDGCGNEATCERPFIVQDAKAPLVFCQPGLSVNLHTDGTIQLWATDFLQYAEDNCTPNQYLKYAVRKAGAGMGFPTDANGNPAGSVHFECAELGPQSVELWCKDKAENAGFCLSTVTLHDNAGYCNTTEPPAVGGRITTEMNEGIHGVSIKVNGTGQFTPPFFLIDTTDANGSYFFDNSIPLSSSLTIKPEYDTNPLNGITTYDLVLISKNILGIEPLGSPYKLIAADANKSNTITTFDIVEIRKLLLGIYQELPNNTSWRFVQKAFVFSNPLNPFQPPFPEEISIAGLFTDMDNGDFIGMKVGDVNNTAVVNANDTPDERSAGTLYFDVAAAEHETVRPGEVFDVAFTGAETMLGCQFTLDYNGLEIVEVMPGPNMERDHFALFPDKKALTMAWEKGGTPAFTLRCKALEAGNLREMLSIGSRITKAEGYQNSSEQQARRFDLDLRFPDLPTFELFQNHPNPFTGATVITFNLPEAGEATLKVYDVDGRLLYAQPGNYARGTHSVTLEKSALDATGVLYYQLETATHSAMRKMVKL